MDSKKILDADYLDILFEGKNKAYGGYELRKKYKKRAFLAVAIVIGTVLLGYTASKIKPKQDIVIAEPPPKIEDVELKEPPPLKEDEPPPPPVATPPPPVKSTFKFEPPVVAKNNEVRETEKIEKPPEDKPDAVAGPENTKGSEDPRAMDPGMNKSGDGNVISKGPEEDPDKIHVNVEQRAKPPYDPQVFVRKNLVYPELAKASEIEGKVMVSFIVERDGRITGVKLEGKDIGGGCGQAAVDVVKKFPKWEPAQQGGKPVRSYFRFPINFRLDR